MTDKKANMKKPNVIVILTDDQGFLSLGCYGNSDIKTPNLDRLAERGIRFENFFCTSPVCSPARASLLTGRIPSQHGVHDWIREVNTEKEIDYLAGQTAYTDILAANGYKCGISGKWHLGMSRKIQKSFSHWYVHQKGGGPYYDAPMIKNGELVNEEEYVTDVITDDALEFIDKYNDEKEPFYLSVHYTAPHSPWGPEQHPDQFLNMYKDCQFNSIQDKPLHPWQTQGPIHDMNFDRQQILQGYAAAIIQCGPDNGKIRDSGS